MKGKGLEATYKFAIFGLRAAGKTCFIVSLAAPRLAHPKKHSIRWFSNDKSSESDIFMNESVNNLLDGTPIKKTEIGTNIRHFIFDFSTERDGRTRILLSDYAGELLNEAEDNATANELRQTMKKYDGIIILSEYPRENQKNADFALPFNALGRAFDKITMEDSSINQRKIPVILLVNKWDRSGPINFSDPESEQINLENFLAQNPSPPHKALFNSISTSVGPDNICIRPVSAFGESKSTQNADEDFREIIVLKNGQVHSFGVEESFEWLVNRANELEFEKLKSKSFFEIGYKQLKLMHKLKKRLSTELPYYAELLSLIKNQWIYLAKKTITYALTAISLFVLVIMGGETFLDYANKQSIDTQTTAELTEEKLQVNEIWLSNYANSSQIQHFLSRFLVISKNDAKNDSAIINIKRLQILVTIAETAETAETAEKREAYENLINKFPGSPETERFRLLLAILNFEETIYTAKTEIEIIDIAIRNTTSIAILDSNLLKLINVKIDPPKDTDNEPIKIIIGELLVKKTKLKNEILQKRSEAEFIFVKNKIDKIINENINLPNGNDLETIGKLENLSSRLSEIKIDPPKDTDDGPIKININELIVKKTKLGDDINKKISKINVEIIVTKKLKASKTFINHLEEGNLDEAITFYSDNKPLLELDQIKKLIKTIGLRIFENKINKENQLKNFDNSIKLIGKIENDPVLAKEIFDKDDFMKINELKKGVYKAEEKYRYTEFFSYAKVYKLGDDTESLLREILKYETCKEKTKIPEQVVSNFKTFILESEKPFRPSFKIKEIEWGENFFRRVVTVTGKLVIKINDTEVLSNETLETLAGGKTSKIINFDSVNYFKINESVLFECTVTGNFFRFGSGTLDGGVSSKKIILKDLVSSAGYPISATGGVDGNTNFTVWSTYSLQIPELISPIEVK